MSYVNHVTNNIPKVKTSWCEKETNQIKSLALFFKSPD